MHRYVILIAVFLVFCGLSGCRTDDVSPLGADEEMRMTESYMRAYGVLTHADEAKTNKAKQDAISLYREALGRFESISKQHPDWRSHMVNYRIDYCRKSLALLGVVDESGEEDISPPPADNIKLPPELDTAVADERIDLSVVISSARFCLTHGEPGEAREFLMQAMKADPDNREVRLLMGVTQCKLGKYADAVMLLKELVREVPDDARARLVLGVAYFGLKKTEEARIEIDSALGLNPQFAEAHFNMAKVLSVGSSADREQAKEHYSKALKLGMPKDEGLEKLLED